MKECKALLTDTPEVSEGLLAHLQEPSLPRSD